MGFRHPRHPLGCLFLSRYWTSRFRIDRLFACILKARNEAEPPATPIVSLSEIASGCGAGDRYLVLFKLAWVLAQLANADTLEDESRRFEPHAREFQEIVFETGHKLTLVGRFRMNHFKGRLQGSFFLGVDSMAVCQIQRDTDVGLNRMPLQMLAINQHIGYCEIQ